MIIDNRKGLGTNILALTGDEVEYLIYILNMDEWRPNADVDPVGAEVHRKITRLSWRGTMRNK